MAEEEKLILAIEERKAIEAPDLTILVRRVEVDDRLFKYKYTLISFKSGVELYYRECESQDLGKDYETLLSHKHDSFSSCMRSKESRIRLAKRLKIIGKKLYRSLFDYEFDSIYWDAIENKVRSVQIISNEPIPWELIYPVNLRTGGTSGKGFWGELYNIAHWFPGKKPSDQLRFDCLNIVKSLEGESAFAEEAWIRQAFDNKNIACILLEPSLDPVSEALSSSQSTLLHVICHGGNNSEDGDQDFIKLSDGNLTPDDIEDCEGEEPSDCLVFLNGCQTGVLGPGLSGLGGWAFNLATRAKRNVIVGTIWKVPSDSACDFAIAFYNALYPNEAQGQKSIEGQQLMTSSVLEAVRIARRQARVNDPTRLSYKVYGSPLATIFRD